VPRCTPGKRSCSRTRPGVTRLGNPGYGLPGAASDQLSGRRFVVGVLLTGGLGLLPQHRATDQAVAKEPTPRASRTTRWCPSC